MFRHLLAALMLTSLLTISAQAQQYDTPGSWDAIRYEPCADELQPTGGTWIGRLGQAGYATTDRSFFPMDEAISEYFGDLKAGWGVWYQNSHATENSYVIKVFNTERARNDTLYSYDHTEYKNYLDGTGYNGLGQPVISITKEGIQKYFKSHGSLVFNAGCYAGKYNSYWPNARAVLGYTYAVDNGTVGNDATAIMNDMLGRNGSSLRVLSAAIQGTNLTPAGNLNTVINPSVLWTSPSAGATVNKATPLVIKFDCPVQIAGWVDQAALGLDGIAVDHIASSDPYTISGYVGPWTRGPGAVLLRSFNPKNFQFDGVQGRTGGIGLDADASMGPSDLRIDLYSAVDNPAASLSSLSATRQNGGAHVAWRAETQSGTNRYLLFRSSSLLGPWQFVATVPADSTTWDYAIDDPGIADAFYELREVENKGDTLVLGNAETRDPFAISFDPAPTAALADSLSQNYWMTHTQEVLQPQAVLPIYDITYVLPVDPTGAWTSALQPLVADRQSKGFLVNVITMDQVGNSREGLHEYIKQAFKYGLRGVTLGASDEDSRSWDKYPWINGWTQQTWPGNPQWALIPMWDWPDPIGVQSQSVSWFRPGMTSDMPYGDVTGDSIPEIPVTRIPAMTPAGLAVAVAKILAYERQNLSHGSFIIADQGRSYNGESGAWASALADSFAAMIPQSLNKIRLHDTDSYPIPHSQALWEFLSAVNTSNVVGATFTGTLYNRNRWSWIDRTEGDSWSSLNNGTFLSAVAAPTCELAGTDRRVDPTFGPGLATASFNSYPNQAPAWIWASNNGSHQGSNLDLGTKFYFYIYRVGCWSGAEGARAAVYDAAQNGFEKYQALGTEILGDVCSPFPGQILRTTSVERSNANQLRLAVDRNPSFSQLGINFTLPTDAAVDLAIFDLQGRRLATLANGSMTAGMHRVVWDGTASSGAVSGGMYFLRLSAPAGNLVQKVTFLR